MCLAVDARRHYVVLYKHGLDTGIVILYLDNGVYKLVGKFLIKVLRIDVLCRI